MNLKPQTPFKKFLATMPYGLILISGLAFCLVTDPAVKAVTVVVFLAAIVTIGFFKEGSEDDRMARIEKLKKEIGFGRDYIEFYKPYEFRHGSVRKQPRITLDMVNEICLDTHPPSMVINKKEVIFFPFKFKEELRLFALRNKIPVSKRKDIWEQLCIPYLDTTRTVEENRTRIELLLENGITMDEQASIQQKIGRQISFANAYAMEWVYLGQYDVLRTITPLSKNFYWYSMEVALRNFYKQSS